MKVIAVNRTLYQELPELPHVEFIPDSAILAPGKPFFIPDIQGSWTLKFYIVFHVSRLGKSIAERFGHRYYDTVTIAARPVSDSFPAHLATGMDGGWIMGEWIPYQPSQPLTIRIGDNEPFAINHEQLKLDIAIERLSRIMTLKMGDIIAPVILPPSITPVAENRINATLNDNEILNFKIK